MKHTLNTRSIPVWRFVLALGVIIIIRGGPINLRTLIFFAIGWTIADLAIFFGERRYHAWRTRRTELVSAEPGPDFGPED